VSDNGEHPVSEDEVEAAEPIMPPFIWRCDPAGFFDLPDGSRVKALRLTFRSQAGDVAFVMSHPDAKQLAEDLRTAAGGLVIAHSIPEDP
jgi:hypothetical protein